MSVPEEADIDPDPLGLDLDQDPGLIIILDIAAGGTAPEAEAPDTAQDGDPLADSPPTRRREAPGSTAVSGPTTSATGTAAGAPPPR